MAIEVGEAYVSIIPSAKGFLGHLHNIIGPGISAAGTSAGNEAGSGFLSGFASSLGRIAAVVTGALAAAGLGRLFSEAVSTTMNFETTQVSFAGLLGSMEEAQKRMAELQAFARVTPFEFPELAEASKKLLAFGFSADQVIPVMTQLGNAGAALGASGYDINLVVRALGQIKGKGRVMQEELNQIAEALPGFNPLKALSEEMGVSLEELQNNIGKPGGLLKAFGLEGSAAVDMLLKSMERIPGAMGAMDRQSKTLRGSWNTLKDTFREVAVASLLPLFPGVSAFIRDELVPRLLSLKETLPPLVASFAKGFGDIIDAVQSFVRTFRTGMTEDEGTFIERLALAARRGFEILKTVFAEIKQAVTDFVAGFGGEKIDKSPWDDLGNAVKFVYEKFVELMAFVNTNKQTIIDITLALGAGVAAFAAYGAAVLVASKAMEALAAAKLLLTGGTALGSILAQFGSLAAAAGPIGLLVAAIVAVAAGIVLLYLKWKPFRDFVDGAVDGLVNGAVAAFNALKEAVRSVQNVFTIAWAYIQAAVTIAVATIITALTPLANWFQEHLFPAIMAVVGFFVAWGQLIFTTVSHHVEVILNILRPFVTTLIEIFQVGFEIIRGIWELAWNAFTTIVEVGVSIILPIWTTFFETMLNIADSLFTLVKNAIEVILGVIRGVFEAATALIKGDWSGFWEAIKSVASTVFEGVKTAIKTVLDTIKDHFSIIFGAVPGIVEGIVNGIKGFIDGLVGALESAADTIGNVVGRIKDAVSSIPGAGVVGNIAGALFGAAGGIVRRPTLMVVGEAGPEAVVPLGMFGAGGSLPPLRQSIAHSYGVNEGAGATGQVVINLYAPLGVDRTEVISAVSEGLRRNDAARRGTY